jgi:hypothetical protein
MHLLMPSQIHEDILACRIEEHTYGEGHVSWTNKGDKFYIHVMDRAWHAARIQECKQRFTKRTCK